MQFSIQADAMLLPAEESDARASVDFATSHPQPVRFKWDDGCEAEFDPTWLRHNAPGIRLASGQSLLDPADLPADLSATTISTAGDQAIITWSDGSTPTTVASSWLRSHATTQEQLSDSDYWHEALGDRLTTAKYDAWCSDDAALRDWLTGYKRHGIALLQDVPTRAETLEQVVERFAILRVTNYGRVFSVRSRVDPDNLADSALALPLHTDNPYRDPPPDAQLLHCLRSDTEGGESLFADGIAAAQRLAQQDPDAFEILSHTPVRFCYQTDEAYLQAIAPMIELDHYGSVHAIRFNSRSMTPLPQPAREVGEFYRAYRALHAQLHHASAVERFKLNPGEVVLMDNRRLLHGRSAFTRGGNRHLRGCYLQGDSIDSKLAILRRGSAVPTEPLADGSP